MARIFLTDGFLSVGGVDLSTRLIELSIDDGFEEIAEGAMGHLTPRGRRGLYDPKIMAKFRQDYASGSVDATLFPLNGTATTTVIARGKSDAAAVTNGEWTLNPAYVDYPSPGGASTGKSQDVDATFLGAGTAVVYAEA